MRIAFGEGQRLSCFESSNRFAEQVQLEKYSDIAVEALAQTHDIIQPL
jgi:hypothetical protein